MNFPESRMHPEQAQAAGIQHLTGYLIDCFSVVNVTKN